jgi:hypothetical protein
MTWKRSFTPDSWFNTPIPASVQVASNSAAMIKAQALRCPPPTVGNPTGGWAMPWSEATASSPTATITDGKTSVKLKIDPHVGEMSGDDAAIVWRDLSTGLEVATFETLLSHKSDGTVDVKKPIRCTGYAIYKTGSNGLSRQVGGDKKNTGHRGIPPSTMALHSGEVDSGQILQRKKIAFGQPSDHPGPNFPMYGIESPRNGGIPEGAVIRYKGPIGNLIQQAAHDYGFIVGDTAGDGKSILKTVQGGVFSLAILKALDGTTWDDWDVMTLGWR